MCQWLGICYSTFSYWREIFFTFCKIDIESINFILRGSGKSNLERQTPVLKKRMKSWSRKYNFSYRAKSKRGLVMVKSILKFEQWNLCKIEVLLWHRVNQFHPQGEWKEQLRKTNSSCQKRMKSWSRKYNFSYRAKSKRGLVMVKSILKFEQ